MQQNPFRLLPRQHSYILPHPPPPPHIHLTQSRSVYLLHSCIATPPTHLKMSTAFVTATPFLASAARPCVVATSRRAVPVMSARKQAARLAAIPASLVTVAPTLATEGTGEGKSSTLLSIFPSLHLHAVFHLYRTNIPFVRHFRLAHLIPTKPF